MIWACEFQAEGFHAGIWAGLRAEGYPHRMPVAKNGGLRERVLQAIVVDIADSEEIVCHL